MADEVQGRVIGHGPCPNCGANSSYKVNKKGHLYVYCVTEGDGGCHSGTQSRSQKGDVELAKRITKWTNATDKKKLLGGGASQDETPKKPKAKEPAKAWWDREII